MSGGTVSVRFDAGGRETSLVARVSTSPNRFHQTFTAVAASRDSETPISEQTTDTLSTQAVVEAGRVVGRGHLLARVELSRATADFLDERPTSTIDRALADRRDAVSLQAAAALSASVSLNGGVRQEWRAAPESGDGRDGATVGHARVTWTVAPEWTVRGSVASSHRWPTLNELVRNFQVGNVLTLANPELRPEQAVSVDGAVTYQASRWQVSVGGFRTAVTEAIANVTIPSLTGIVRERRNAGDTRSTGLEIDGEFRPGGGTRIRTSIAVSDAEFVASDEAALVGNRLPQVPDTAVSLWIDVPLARAIVASAIVRHVSSQFDDDRNRFELAPATQLDLGVSGRVRWFGWHLQIENALDAAIEVGRTPLVTLAPPRTVRAGVTIAR
jgi:outer membrane receptor protein involved in Fe transport